MCLGIRNRFVDETCYFVDVIFMLFMCLVLLENNTAKAGMKDYQSVLMEVLLSHCNTDSN